MTLDKLKSWIKRDLGQYAEVEESVETAGSSSVGTDCGATDAMVVRVYTDTNCYTIRAVERYVLENIPPAREDAMVTSRKVQKKGYLGCQASGRKPRAGAQYTGGRDLPDGLLTEETWRRILAAIVSFEMVRVHHNSVQTAWDHIRKAPWPGETDEHNGESPTRACVGGVLEGAVPRAVAGDGPNGGWASWK